MKTPQDAWNILAQNIVPLQGLELPLADAQGGYLAQVLLADRDIPPADRATMDGYALRGNDLNTLPARLIVDGEIAAGSSSSLHVVSGHCVRIFTGAIIPNGADSVVPVEQTSTKSFRDPLDDREIQIAEPATKGSYISRQADHAHAGEVLLSIGTRFGPRQIGIAAATGYDRVAVHCRPVIRILTTGKELREAHQPTAPYHTRDSNGPMLLAALREAGFTHAISTIVPDSLKATTDAIVRALNESDAVIVSGGISAGRYDYVPQSLAEAGAMILYRGVAMKPGRPQLFAMSVSHQPIFGLPGNPLSAIVGFYELVLPAMRLLAGCPVSGCRPLLHLPLGSSVSNYGDLLHVIPAVVTMERSGSCVDPRPSIGSADFVTGGRVDGAILLAPRAGNLPSGSMVPFRPWGGIGV